MPDESRYSNPDLIARYVRNAAASVAAPDPPADMPAVYELQTELRALRAEVKTLRGVVRTISRVAAPYAGNGR